MLRDENMCWWCGEEIEQAQRHKWRADAQGKVVVDANIPDPPKPRDLLKELDDLTAEIEKMKAREGVA